MFARKNRLKKLKVTSVDLCKQGANQDANITLMKSREGGDNVSEYENIAKSFASAFVDESIDETLSFYAKSMEESEASIMGDESLTEDEKSKMLEESKGQFYKAIADLLKSTKADEESDEEDPKEDPKEDPEKEMEVEKDMEFEIEKMSEADKATYEELKKKYSKTEEVEIHPEVKKAMDEVAELRKALEKRDLMDVAKSYEIIGKKPEELVEKLYDLKQAGGNVYDEYIGLLDEMKKTAESGVFKEFGSNKSGENSNLAQAVNEVMKQFPTLTPAQAVVKAYELNPELDEMM